MKKILLTLVAAALLAACSAPKYAYHFDHYDYNSGKKHAVVKSQLPNSDTQQISSPVLLDEQTVVADASTTPSVMTNENTSVNIDKKALTERVAAMSKSERMTFKHDLKKYIKKIKKSPDHGASVAASKEWDHDLKMAAIFGIVGIVLTALGGVNTVFWVIGVIAIVVGLVFLIKWIARQ
jgi:hypothetical protein